MTDIKEKTSIKEKIEDKVEEIVYRKAKEEIKSRAKNYVYSVKEKLFGFIGWKGTRSYRINQMSKEIVEKEDVLIDNNVVSVLELYTMSFANALIDLAGGGMGVEKEQDFNEKEQDINKESQEEK